MSTLLKPAPAADAARAELDDWIAATQDMSLLRFITCGSVDDGKSTLIGRMLYDSKLLLEDQLSALGKDSKKHGTQGKGLDFALLVDGLSAEREQGITIDVAYRFFATEKRKFIVADTPGHEQYTRNMVTGASTADLAVILVDARKGILAQTRRHSLLVHLLGIRHVLLAVNKMDLVDYDEAVFHRLVGDYDAFAADAGIGAFTAIPVSGLAGDNIICRSERMAWHHGPSLLEHLESVPAGPREQGGEPFRMAVQYVSRPDHSFRGYAGRVASGRVREGDAVLLLPSRRQTAIARIIAGDGDLPHASAGQSVMLTFADEVDCGRGEVIVPAGPDDPGTATRIDATLIWMAEEKLVARRSYWLKIGAQTVSARVEVVRSAIDVRDFRERQGGGIGLNDIGKVAISLDSPVPAIRYAANRKLGGFILIDKLSRATVGCGLVDGFPDAPKVANEEGDSIRWVIGRERTNWAAAAASRLRAQGHRVAILDHEALAAFGAPDLVRAARQAARLLAGTGAIVLVTLRVALEDAFPGRCIDSEIAGEEGQEWVI